jgi:L-methionine (R)-S-oxide reductase
MTQQQKKVAYQLALNQIDSVLEGESHAVLKMATINCILKENLQYYFWTGFYLVHNGELIVGPYQGTLGCLHIAFGKGVCGTAAKEKKTQVVKDVNKFPGHIACDSRSQSEIVVPVFNNKKKLIAVFDVDSDKKESFDTIDQQYLEAIMHRQFTSSLLENC